MAQLLTFAMNFSPIPNRFPSEYPHPGVEHGRLTRN